MAFGTPRVPSAYPALDSAAITRSGGPALDALITDTIAQAHNRLQAAGAQMFSIAVPSRGITHGDLTVPSYTQPATLTWAPLMPAIPHRKKPGHRLADYRAIVMAPSGTDFELQVVTSRAPFSARPGGGLVQIAQATGTGSWQTVSINGVAVDPGVSEASALLVRTDDIGAAHVAGTYGTPVSGTGVGAGPALGVDQLFLNGADPSSWALTETAAPNDYGTRGYFVEVTDSNATVIGYFRLSAVWGDPADTITGMVATFRDPIPSAIRAAANVPGVSGSWGWKLYDPVRISIAGFAGATVDRSPT